MRSRLYALSFVDHSSYSNFHATASFRKIDKLSSIFYDIRLSDLVGTFLCSRSARLVYRRNDPLQKGFCSVNPSLDICSGLLSQRVPFKGFAWFYILFRR